MISINLATSMSFSSDGIGRESDGFVRKVDETLWKIRTGDEKSRRFQTFNKKVMNMKLKRHCILIIFTDTNREEYPNCLGGNPPVSKLRESWYNGEYVFVRHCVMYYLGREVLPTRKSFLFSLVLNLCG
ncbi:hypothetical protein MKX03_037582 [Papaver bracteatum]|nr:hypothetical protein MKX03_037582 [Papaver bracteatum]